MKEHSSIRVAGAEEAPDLPIGSVADMNRKLNDFTDGRGLERGGWKRGFPAKQPPESGASKPPTPASVAGPAPREREAIGERIKLAIIGAKLTLGYLAVVEDATPEKIERVIRGEAGLDALRRRLCERLGVGAEEVASPSAAPSAAPAKAAVDATKEDAAGIGRRIRAAMEAAGFSATTLGRDIGHKNGNNVSGALNGLSGTRSLQRRLCVRLGLDDTGTPISGAVVAPIVRTPVEAAPTPVPLEKPTVAPALPLRQRMDICERIKRVMHQQGVSQKELAKEFGYGNPSKINLVLNGSASYGEVFGKVCARFGLDREGNPVKGSPAAEPIPPPAVEPPAPDLPVAGHSPIVAAQPLAGEPCSLVEIARVAAVLGEALLDYESARERFAEATLTLRAVRAAAGKAGIVINAGGLPV